MLVEAGLAVQFVFGLTILVRAIQKGSISRYPLFYSYLIYYLAAGAVDECIYVWAPAHYPTFFWIKFLTLVMAEFALLLEIGDHLFAQYPALRQLARMMTVGIALVFCLAYILPPLLERRPSEVAIFDLVKRSALTKGVIFLGLGVTARHFRIGVGRSIMGIAAGLICFLGINMANFALAQSLGRIQYGAVFSAVGIFSHTLMLLVWAVSLWRIDPALATGSPNPPLSGGPLMSELGKYNRELDRLLRR